MQGDMERLGAWDVAEGERQVTALFAEAFGRAPEAVALGPGRVNVIGEHVDYNAGMCLPVALPHATYAAVARAGTDRVRVVSAQEQEPWEGTLADLPLAPGWAAYVAGVLLGVAERDPEVPGLDVAITSCVPVGAGLSSSAALETGVASAVLGLLNTKIRPDELVDLCVRAESHAGARTGGLDQSAAIYAQEGEAVLLDFHKHSAELVPFDTAAHGLELLVVDTGVRHRHAGGGYAERRAECEEAARLLGVTSLRELLDREGELEELPEPLRSRARHVVSEIARVARIVGALRVDAWEEVGDLLDESHASMRDDFAISTPELDATVEAARAGGALGARLTGGGFGGSAIALVPADRVEDVCSRVAETFAGNGWREPACTVVRASGPTRLLSVGG